MHFSDVRVKSVLHHIFLLYLDKYWPANEFFGDLAPFRADVIVQLVNEPVFIFSERLVVDCFIEFIYKSLPDLLSTPPTHLILDPLPIFAIFLNELEHLLVFFLGPLFSQLDLEYFFFYTRFGLMRFQR